MKYLICPDSFKGSFSAQEFCQIAEKAILSVDAGAEIKLLPMADGGEGTLDCLFSAMNGTRLNCQVLNPLNEKKSAYVGLFENGKTAVVESALANGLPLIKGRENPLITSTYGVGQLIVSAIENGAEKVILTLGGSSTNDCGLGMLSALGAVFFNSEGKSFIPTGGNLNQVADFDFSQLYSKIDGITFEAMCDVDNPLCGFLGCSRVFAPQKGAGPEMVSILESGCNHIKELFFHKLGMDYSESPGAGAAGGLGFAVIAGLKGKLKSGSKMVLDLCDFDKNARIADFVLTGEGAFDRQSLMGKIVGTIINHCSDKKVVVFCGKQKEDVTLPENVQICEISSGQELEYAILHGKENLEYAIKNFNFHL